MGKYPTVFALDMTPVFVKKLFNASLLRGKFDSHSRKILILEESWLNLIRHMNYTLELKKQPVDGEEITISVPEKYKSCSPTRYRGYVQWKTPAEIIEDRPYLADIAGFDACFLVELVKNNILLGKQIKTKQKIVILMPFLDALLNYRNETLERAKISINPDRSGGSPDQRPSAAS